MLCSFANHSNVYSFRKEIQRDNTRICNQDISLIYDGWSIVGNQIKLFEKRNRPWQDSNLQSPNPKSGALSIRPHGLTLTVDFTNQTWHRSVSKHVAIFLREVFESKTSFDEIKNWYRQGCRQYNHYACLPKSITTFIIWQAQLRHYLMGS